MNDDYDYLTDGWREIARLLADIRDELRAMNADRGELKRSND